MSYFWITVDRVRVGDDFACTPDQFAAIEPAWPGLPAGIKECRYFPGAPAGRPKHVLKTDTNDARGGPDRDPALDAIIARAAEYPDLLAARFPPETPAAPDAEAKDRQLDARLDEPLVAALIDQLAAAQKTDRTTVREAIRAQVRPQLDRPATA